MEKEKRFKIGDKITYKPMKDCTHYDGRKNSYYFGGNEQEGHVGKIVNYLSYVEYKECWRIHVTTIKSGSYGMLECEFIEYTKPTQDLFPIY